MSEFTLPLRRLLAGPHVEPLVEVAARRLIASEYYPLGDFLASLDTVSLQALRDLRSAALEEVRPDALKSYATLVKVLALAEGIFIDDEPELHAYAGRLTEAITVATLAHLGFATVAWRRVSLDPSLTMPWSLTESGQRHVQAQARRSS